MFVTWTEKNRHEKCLRALAEGTKRHRQGLAMTGKENWLVDAGARAKLSGEGALSDLGHFPWEIDIHFKVTGCSEPSCWKVPLLASTTSVERFRAQDS